MWVQAGQLVDREQPSGEGLGVLVGEKMEPAVYASKLEVCSPDGLH